MEKDVESVNDNNDESLMMNSSQITESSNKPWMFAKVPKSGVVLLSTIVISCTLFYFASYNNRGILFEPTQNFSSLYDKSVHDDEYHELKKVLEEASTEDKTVILTTLNEAWAKPNSIFDIFLESFKIGNNTYRLLKHLLVIAVDEAAYQRCQTTVHHCYFFRGKISSNKEIAHEAKFMSPIYFEMMWERQAFLHTILKLGYNFVFTDADVMWFRDPFPHFYPNIDFQTSCDSFNGRPSDLKNLPNNGFNFVKSNERTIKFYNFWVSSRRKYPGLHEQNVFNKIKYEPFVKKLGLKIRFLDTNYFGGFCERSKDFNKVCTMHANCCVGLQLKIVDLNATLQDWKKYKSSYQTTSQHPHWTVPNKCRM